MSDTPLVDGVIKRYKSNKVESGYTFEIMNLKRKVNELTEVNEDLEARIEDLEERLGTNG